MSLEFYLYLIVRLSYSILKYLIEINKLLIRSFRISFEGDYYYVSIYEYINYLRFLKFSRLYSYTFYV